MVSWVTTVLAVTEAEELAVMGCSIYADAVSASSSTSVTDDAAVTQDTIHDSCHFYIFFLCSSY